MSRRVAITGLGVISSLGLDRAAFWDAISKGRPGIGPITSVAQNAVRFRNGAEVPGFDPARFFDERQLAQLDRFSQLALVSAREAVADSGLDLTPAMKQRTAVIVGTSVGGQNTQDEAFADIYFRGAERVSPNTIARVMPSAAASHISMEMGFQGPAMTISTACSSSNHAIGQAFWLIRNGFANMAVAGGSETPFSTGSLKAWDAIRVVSPDTCRPFSKDRTGMILGEGAAFLVLEPHEMAMARGARIYCEISGFGMSADAYHIMQPSVDGAARAMCAALADAWMAPEQIGYVNAHGTATAASDPVEVRSLREVFHRHADRLAVSSTKSMHGHTLGAAGALEAAATALALHYSIIPPTANFTEPDPECDLDFVPNHPRRLEVEGAMSNTFGFGGLNASLVFKRRERG